MSVFRLVSSCRQEPITLPPTKRMEEPSENTSNHNMYMHNVQYNDNNHHQHGFFPSSLFSIVGLLLSPPPGWPFPSTHPPMIAPFLVARFLRWKSSDTQGQDSWDTGRQRVRTFQLFVSKGEARNPTPHFSLWPYFAQHPARAPIQGTQCPDEINSISVPLLFSDTFPLPLLLPALRLSRVPLSVSLQAVPIVTPLSFPLRSSNSSSSRSSGSSSTRSRIQQ
jgi:hypothetical protein